MSVEEERGNYLIMWRETREEGEMGEWAIEKGGMRREAESRGQ